MTPRPFDILWFIAALVFAIYLGIKLPRDPFFVAVAVLPFVVIPPILFTTESFLGVIVVVSAGYAGTIGLLNSFPSGLPGLQLHDLFTIILTIMSGATVLLVGQRVRFRWLRADFFYIAFLAWAVMRVYNAPDMFDAAKDIVFFSLYFFICTVTRVYVAARPGRALKVSYFVFLGAVVTVALGAIFALMGVVSWTPTGLLSPLGKRPLAIFLMVVFSAGLSLWLYPEKPTAKRWGAIFSGITGVLILLTFSRTIIVTIVLIHVPLAFVLTNTRRLTSAGNLARIALYIGLVGALAVFALKQDVVQDRWFFQTHTSQLGDLFYWRNLNTMGRANVWPEVWRHAKLSPWIGHGTGSARSYAYLVSHWDHPHCDYLRAFHDQGVIGFSFFTLFWLGKIARLWRLRRLATTQAARQAAFAGLTATVGIVCSFITDNTIVYTYATLPLAILVGSAESRCEADENAAAAADTPVADPPAPGEGAAIPFLPGPNRDRNLA